jgi:hypothetical protein
VLRVDGHQVPDCHWQVTLHFTPRLIRRAIALPRHSFDVRPRAPGPAQCPSHSHRTQSFQSPRKRQSHTSPIRRGPQTFVQLLATFFWSAVVCSSSSDCHDCNLQVTLHTLLTSRTKAHPRCQSTAADPYDGSFCPCLFHGTIRTPHTQQSFTSTLHEYRIYEVHSIHRLLVHRGIIII